jgi:hypothetical protein
MDEDVSPGLPPNSIKYGCAIKHGQSFHIPIFPCQFVTAQSSLSGFEGACQGQSFGSPFAQL